MNSNNNNNNNNNNDNKEGEEEEEKNEFEHTVWSYKKVIDNDLSNKNLEIILNFYDKKKFELNINKFSSNFNIDLETYLEMPINEDNNNNFIIPDNVFESDYHHSLILGSFQIDNDNNIILIMEKIFTNQQNLFDEYEKEIKIINNGNTFSIDRNSVIGKFSEEEIILRKIKQIK